MCIYIYKHIYAYIHSISYMYKQLCQPRHVSRESGHEGAGEAKFCDMSKLHQQDARRLAEETADTLKWHFVYI